MQFYNEFCQLARSKLNREQRGAARGGTATYAAVVATPTRHSLRNVALKNFNAATAPNWIR